MMAVSTEQEIRTFEIVKEESIAASIEVVFRCRRPLPCPRHRTGEGGRGISGS